MHLKRLSRFQEGTVNPNALDNLNWLLLSLFISINLYEYDYCDESRVFFKFDIHYSIISRKDAEAVEMTLNIFCDFIDCAIGIDALKFSKTSIEVDYWFCLIIEDFESFNNWFFVIISATTCLSSFNKSFLELFFAAFKIQNRFQVNILRHLFLPLIKIFLSSWEPIKQISSRVIITLYLLLDKLNHKLTWY